jgi:P-type Mg2+ transporter
MENYASFATKQISEIYSQLQTSSQGLKKQQAIKNLKAYGLNKISVKETRWWHLLIRQFTSPFVYILIFASLLALYLGERIDSIFIAFFVLVGAVLGFVQEYNSQKSVELLKNFLVDHTKVIRDGVTLRVKSEEMVPGDICILEPGDILPADVRFSRADNLLIDESLLTGESIAVSKTSVRLENEQVSGIHQAVNIGFSGTTVMQGKGTGVVISTGKNTQIGSITTLTAESQSESAFEKSMSKLSKWMLKIILATLVLILVGNFLIKKSDDRANFADMILFAIALSVTVIPETLPVVAALSFSKGSLALAKKKTVVKKLSSVEDLGSIEILCTDKTGTITENKMTVSSVSGDNDLCLLYGALASSSEEFSSSFDQALLSKIGYDEQLKKWNKVNEIPFDPERKRNSVLIESQDNRLLIVRGAPDTVLSLCSHMSQQEKDVASCWVEEQEMQGERVVMIAVKSLDEKVSYTAQEEKDLEYIGAVSFNDPIKESTIPALKEARALGVQVKILTGDGKNVASAVAEKIGIIKDRAEVLTGAEFEQMSEEDQIVSVNQVHVFARVSPQQKFRIIQLLKEKYEVGFLGDGINDAPALKLASVAMVVDTASDIARSAADVVLLDSSLMVIIEGIKGGREIFANMVKYLKTTLISNFGNFYAVAIAVLVAPFLPILPAQLLLLNLLRDTPMIAISFDSVDVRELQKPKTFDIKEITRMALIFGAMNAIFIFLFFFLFMKQGASVLQTNVFIGSVLIGITLLFAIRTKKPFWKGARPSMLVSGLCIVLASVAVIIPLTSFGEKVFRFSKPSLESLIVMFGLTILYFFTVEIFKSLYSRVSLASKYKKT